MQILFHGGQVDVLFADVFGRNHELRNNSLAFNVVAIRHVFGYEVENVGIDYGSSELRIPTTYLVLFSRRSSRRVSAFSFVTVPPE